MNEKLASIFVPFEVAKLAKEKGFNEWCACWCFNDGSHYSPVCDHFVWNFNDTPLLFNVPTHYQLINWLSEKGVNVMMSHSVYSEINEALIFALNLIEVKP